MKKLLLTSASIMAFASTLANANEEPQKINLQSLINTAMINVNMADVLPENDAHIIVKKQSKAMLDEATQVQLHNNLLAMSKREDRLNTAKAD